VGVDHHKRYRHLTAVGEGGKVRISCRLPNEREALARVLEDLAEPCCSVVEAGRNWGVLYDLVEELGAEPALANPHQLRAIAQAKVKTDSIDSHMLVPLLRGGLIPCAHVPSAQTRQLKHLLSLRSKAGLRQRLFLVRVRTRVKHRLHGLVDRNHVAPPTCSDLCGRAGRRYLAALELAPTAANLLHGHLGVLSEDRAYQGRAMPVRFAPAALLGRLASEGSCQE